MNSDVKRKQISSAARYGVWYAWGGCCFWCRQPVVYQDCEIDHVIPLQAVSSVGDADKLRIRYGLPSDFEFDDFSNWVPSHPGCNRRKGGLVFDPSPEVLYQLPTVRMQANVAQETAEKIQNDQKSARTLAQLGSQIERGTLSKGQIEDFLATLPQVIRKATGLPEEHLYIAPNWEIIRSGDGRFVRVISNPQAGTAISFTSWQNS